MYEEDSDVAISVQYCKKSYDVDKIAIVRLARIDKTKESRS